MSPSRITSYQGYRGPAPSNVVYLRRPEACFSAAHEELADYHGRVATMLFQLGLVPAAVAVAAHWYGEGTAALLMGVIAGGVFGAAALSLKLCVKHFYLGEKDTETPTKR